MKKHWKDKWLTALRSGEYAQTMGALARPRKNHDSFCCLGVLCDIVDGTKWKESGWDDKHVYGLQYGNCETSFPPVSVLNKVGLSSHLAAGLADMNDGGKKFKTIANYIEKHL